MYEVVTDIPKLEGMERPPRIPVNPSFAELEEGENAVKSSRRAWSTLPMSWHWIGWVRRCR